MDTLPTQPYLVMDETELNKQYSPSQFNNRNLTPDEAIHHHVSWIKDGSEEARQKAPFQVGLTHGPGANAKLDLLLPDSLSKDCPIFVYIHGGYWHFLNREMSSFAALPLYEAGAAFVAVGTDQAPEVSVSETVNQVKSAVRYVLSLAKERGSRGVYLCGHSAGAHLAAMMLTVDWEQELRLSADLIRGALLISGIYDVRPMVETGDNKVLKLTQEEAWELSLFKHLDMFAQHSGSRKVTVAVGDADSPEFQRQSREFHQALIEKGAQVNLKVLEGLDHFTAVEYLRNRDYNLTKHLLKMMELES